MEEKISTQHTIVYSLDDLKNIVNSALTGKGSNSCNGIPIYEIYNNETLPGEIFREYPNNDKHALESFRSFITSGEISKYRIEISNFGRVKIDDRVQRQYQEDYGYLKVRINEKHSYLVYRFVAETWCNCPAEDTLGKWQVHHIDNNGFDNRPYNLIWVTNEEHKTIDPCPWNRTQLLTSILLKKLEYFSIIHFVNKETIEVFEDLCLLRSESVV